MLHESDPTLAKLVADGHLLPVPSEDIQGANGVIYRPAADLLERQTVAAMRAAASSTSMASPTAFKAVTVAGHAWLGPTRWSSLR